MKLSVAILFSIFITISSMADEDIRREATKEEIQNLFKDYVGITMVPDSMIEATYSKHEYREILFVKFNNTPYKSSKLACRKNTTILRRVKTEDTNEYINHVMTFMGPLVKEKTCQSIGRWVMIIDGGRDDKQVLKFIEEIKAWAYSVTQKDFCQGLLNESWADMDKDGKCETWHTFKDIDFDLPTVIHFNPKDVVSNGQIMPIRIHFNLKSNKYAEAMITPLGSLELPFNQFRFEMAFE